MLSASVSAMSGCVCLLSRICPWDLKFRLNLFLPSARNGFEFVGLFGIALCIFTESSFWWTQINAEMAGQMSARLQAITAFSPSDLAWAARRVHLTLTVAGLPDMVFGIKDETKSTARRTHDM
jgi:hypothetical protein